MAELRLITQKDSTIKTTKSPTLVDAVAPQASPMISDPKFGIMNSALETVPSNFTVSNMTLSTVFRSEENKKRTLGLVKTMHKILFMPLL
jgi:hypothetical protein